MASEDKYSSSNNANTAYDVHDHDRQAPHNTVTSQNESAEDQGLKSAAQEKESKASQVDMDAVEGADAVHQAALDGGLGEGMGLPLDDDYFSISSFLVDQTLVDVVTTQNCPYGGFADTNSAASGSLHLLKGRRLQLPLATAATLHARGLVSMHLPPIFDESVLTNIRRNALVVNIKKLHPYYFELGMKLAAIFKDDHLAKTLLTAAEERMILLMQLADEDVTLEQEMSQSTSGLSSYAAANALLAETRGVGNSAQSRQSRRAGHSSGGAGWGGHGGSSSGGNTVLAVPFSGGGSGATGGAVRQRPLDIGLFLMGLSVSEAEVFQKRKEELVTCLSHVLN